VNIIACTLCYYDNIYIYIQHINNILHTSLLNDFFFNYTSKKGTLHDFFNAQQFHCLQKKTKQSNKFIEITTLFEFCRLRQNI